VVLDPVLDPIDGQGAAARIFPACSRKRPVPVRSGERRVDQWLTRFWKITRNFSFTCIDRCFYTEAYSSTVDASTQQATLNGLLQSSGAPDKAAPPPIADVLVSQLLPPPDEQYKIST